ncbi:PREDICTED: zinc finger CCCH domain-containing protein 3 [Nicrophorus vespilloides]|uniref:Zinc finger CCCH domain-containing protein 3 n=1 Tax=Nicrophorus vespilloides TaxID=110193 RepID=A0ABM1ME21_NICVS|nr:PREDICTED: zinc finger CCCH domain-containing protein 3 [Nicrophorus vespilloides]
MSSYPYDYHEGTNLLTNPDPNGYYVNHNHHMRKIYINKNFTPHQMPVNVHVNPNFKRQVHINPNFNGNVHINPSVLQNSKTNVLQPTVIQKASKPEFIVNTNTKKVNVAPVIKKVNKPDYIINTTTKKINVPIVAKAPKPSLPEYLVNTNTKKINVAVQSYSQPKVILTQNKFIRLPAIQKKVIRTKYKLIRTNVAARSPKLQTKFKLDYRKKQQVDVNHGLISMFKLDRRFIDPNKIIRTRYKLIKAHMMNLNPRREIIKPKLITKKAPLSRFIKIRGRVFKFSTNYQSLHLISTSTNYYRKLSQIIIRGSTYVQKDANTYVKFRKCDSVKLNKAALRKDNMPCVVFRKTGVCQKYKMGKCFKRHNKDQIRICIKFLQGACVRLDCPLSHKVSSEKMPTCKFYLEGKCRKDNCQYLHVKLSKDAKICQDFLQGFCTLGRDCVKKHQFICPNFEADGKCNEKQCPYPHGSVVRLYKHKLVNKIVRSTRVKKVEQLAKRKRVDVAKKVEKVEVARYYAGDTIDDCDEAVGEGKSFMDRPKVGNLPAFIPFDE